MFWQSLIAALIGLGLIQLGALSVWASVLSLVLKTVLAVIATAVLFVGLLFAWKRYKGK